MQRHLISRPGVRINALTTGKGPLVVILPSLGRGAEDLRDLACLLAVQGFCVCLPDPRGIGQSEGRMDTLTLDDLADDVHAVITTLGGGPAWLAGHAYGNWVARNLATRHPGHVSGIALLAAAHKNIAPSLRQHIDICMNMALSTTQRLASLEHAFFAPGHDASIWLTGWHPAVAHAQRRAAQACPQPLWWQAGKVPVLDLQAEQDPFAPALTAHELSKELGADRVHVVRIPNASHALIPEQPQAVSQALTDFFHGRRRHASCA